IHHQETTALIAIRCHIAEQLNQQLAGKLLPVSMREFFSQQWPDVLFEAMVSGGIEGDDWANAMALQQQLLESASPVDNEDRRRNLSRLVPSLVKNLRESLERAGYSLAELSLFFTQLKELHLTNVQGKLVTQDFVSWQPLSPEAWVPTETVMASTADRCFYE